MKFKTVELIERQLTLGSKKTISQYRSRLGSDRSEDFFDSILLNDMIRKYGNSQQVIDSVLTLAGETGYANSHYVASLIQDGIDRFCTDDHPRFRWNRNYRRALEEVIEEFKRAELKPLEYLTDEDIIQAVTRPKAHAGWSWVLSGHVKKADYFEDVRQTFEAIKDKAKQEGSFNKPILCGARLKCSEMFTEGGIAKHEPVKQKTRLVSMMDVYYIIAETIWAKPFQKWLGLRSEWYCGGKSRTNLYYDITHARCNNEDWICLDYSSYDQSISSWLIEDSFRCIASAFTTLGDEFLFNIMVDDFINKVFCTAEGWAYSNKGVPSGSMWTNLIDSIVNYLMVKTYFKSVGKEKFTCFIMGDDNLIYYTGEINLELIASYLTKNFGVKVNASKCGEGSADQDPVFLSTTWTRFGATRDIRVLLSKMMFPDHFRRYSRDRKPGTATPEEVLYAYYLSYPVSMSKFFDMDRFLLDFPRMRSLDLDELAKGGTYVTGSLMYYYRFVKPLME